MRGAHVWLLATDGLFGARALTLSLLRRTHVRLRSYATIGTMSEVAAENASAVLAPQQEQTPAPVLGEVLASFPAATAVPTASSRPETEAPAAKSVTPPARQEQLPPQTQPQPQRQESHPTPTTESAFRPSRRVREPIGGGSALISALFGGSADDEERHNEAVREAARENARRRGLLQERATEQQTQSPELAKPSVKDSAAVPDAITAEIVDNRENIEKLEAFRPTRRVRWVIITPPGARFQRLIIFPFLPLLGNRGAQAVRLASRSAEALTWLFTFPFHLPGRQRRPVFRPQQAFMNCPRCFLHAHPACIECALTWCLPRGQCTPRGAHLCRPCQQSELPRWRRCERVSHLAMQRRCRCAE